MIFNSFNQVSLQTLLNEHIVIQKYTGLGIILVVNGIPISCAVPVVGAQDVTDAGLVFGRP